MSWIVPLMAFGVVAGAAYFLLRRIHRQSICIDARLAALEQGNAAAAPTAPPGDPLLPKFLQRFLPDSQGEQQSFQKRFQQAGIYSPHALEKFFAAKVLAMIVPPLTGLGVGIFGLIDMKAGLLYGSIAGCLALVLPTIWLNRAIARRQLTLRRSLPDFLDLLVICLESGSSLQSGLQRVTEELGVAHPDLAKEMGAVQQDIELGANVDQALRRFAERSGNESVKSLSAFVREAMRFGTEVSEALRLHAEMLRAQREEAAEEMAQKAAVKILAPTLLLVFPTVFVVLAGPAIIQIQEAFAK